MKKITIMVILFGFFVFQLFGAGRTESGRDFGQSSIEDGRFVAPAVIDAYAFINDYTFPFAANENEDLSIFVKLEKERILTVGGNVNLFIGLRVNERDFFERREGNYIVFIHNPEILFRTEWEKAFIAVLSRIRESMHSDAIFGIFNPHQNKIMHITDIASIQAILDTLKPTRKIHDVSIILERSFRAMEAIENSYDTRLLWVTDSDLLRGTNAARNRQYFDFLMRLQTQNRISFSYLGYGEVPNWAAMNVYLKNVGGNSYYIHSHEELEDIIWDDFERFVHPTIENIRINVSLMPWVTESRFDFRSEWYPLVNFRPTASFYTHTRSNEILSMDFGTHRIFQYYLTLGSIISTQENLFYRDIARDGNTPLGFVAVQYYSFREGRTIYRSFPLVIRYTEDFAEYTAHFNHYVRKFTILQNTGFILKEISQLVSRREFFNAILLVNSQINLLERILEENYDEMIANDILTLRLNRDLLMNQARSLNLIR